MLEPFRVLKAGKKVLVTVGAQAIAHRVYVFDVQERDGTPQVVFGILKAATVSTISKSVYVRPSVHDFKLLRLIHVSYLGEIYFVVVIALSR